MPPSEKRRCLETTQTPHLYLHIWDKPRVFEGYEFSKFMASAVEHQLLLKLMSWCFCLALRRKEAGWYWAWWLMDFTGSHGLNEMLCFLLDICVGDAKQLLSFCTWHPGLFTWILQDCWLGICYLESPPGDSAESENFSRQLGNTVAPSAFVSWTGPCSHEKRQKSWIVKAFDSVAGRDGWFNASE